MSQELRQKPRRDTSYRFVPPSLLNLLSHTKQNHLLVFHSTLPSDINHLSRHNTQANLQAKLRGTFCFNEESAFLDMSRCVPIWQQSMWTNSGILQVLVTKHSRLLCCSLQKIISLVFSLNLLLQSEHVQIPIASIL